MTKCEDCGYEAPIQEMHFEVLGDGSRVVCDGCYFSKQPWHTGIEDTDGLLGSD